MKRSISISPYTAFLLIVSTVILTLSHQRFFFSNIDMLALSVHDDSFYYLLPSFHFSRYGYFTFDGINPTYGFQPLYAVCLAGIAVFCRSLQSFMQWALMFNAFLFIAAGFVIYSTLNRIFDDKPQWIQNTSATFAALFFLFNVPVFLSFITLKENALACLLLALIIDLYLRIKRSESVGLKAFCLGALTGCLVLTRILPSSLFIVLILFFVLRRHFIYLIIGFLLPILSWGVYAYYVSGRILPTSASIKSGFLTIFSQMPDSSNVPYAVLVPFEYVFQAMRFSLGFTSKFHYILHPNGWIVYGAPVDMGIHVVFVLVGIICFACFCISLKKKVSQYSFFFLLLAVSLLGLLVTPFLIKAKDLYYYTWYLFALPCLLPLLFGVALSSVLEWVSEYRTAATIEQSKIPNQIMFFIAALTVLFFSFNTYGKLQPITKVEINENLWSNLILASSSYLDQHLKISKFSKIGSFNSGTLGFYLPDQVINLDGLANDDVFHHVENGGSIGEYIQENAIDFCVDLNIEEVLIENEIDFTTLRSFPLNDSDHFSIVQIHPSQTVQPKSFSFRFEGKRYLGKQVIGLFESPDEGWQYSGAAMQSQPTNQELGLFPTVTGYLGKGLIHSENNDDIESSTGEAISPTFTPDENQRLIFMLGGSQSESVGVQLLNEENVLHEWRGDGSSHLIEVNVDLAPYAGKLLHLRVYDEDERPEQFILFDHAIILEKQ